MEVYEIALGDVQVDHQQRISHGKFSNVYKGTWQGTPVALKTYEYLGKDTKQTFREEIKNILQFHQGCPQLVRMFGAVMDNEMQMIVMELALNGNLYDLLRGQKQLDWGIKYQISLDIAYGLKYLHDRHILHRDLKSTNVLLNKEFNAQICGFELEKVKMEMASRSQATSGQFSVGTILWMAPELFEGEAKFSEASDVYAYGMTLYEILSHKIPFEEKLEGRDPNFMVRKWIGKGVRPNLPPGRPVEYKELIKACWEQVPLKRPMAQKTIWHLEQLLKSGVSTASGEADKEQGGSNTVMIQPVLKKEACAEVALPNIFTTGVRDENRSMPPVKATLPVRIFHAAKLKIMVEQKIVNTFLSYVVKGNQVKVEEILERHPHLVLSKGDCKDPAGREFRNITGFQYALWALDWHMWEVMLDYLQEFDDDEVYRQYYDQKTRTKALGHGEHYNFQELLYALKSFIAQYDALKKSNNQVALDRLWVHNIGGAQRKTVAHVAQEYCNPDRPFNPIPDFNKKPFKRQLKLYKDTWWTANIYHGPLGGRGRSSFSGFAIYRSSLDVNRMKLTGMKTGSLEHVKADYAALTNLFETRMRQFRELILNSLTPEKRWLQMKKLPW